MADGQVLIDSKIDTSGVAKGTKALKKEFENLDDVTSKVAAKMGDELEDAGGSAEKAAVSFKELFKANISADLVIGALREMGQAAIELGKQAVTTAAEINASNAQFEQTFKGIEQIASSSLNRIAEETGITATRMQDSYSSIFAFTKSVGAEQEQALNISERALKAAADSAAYYDKSIEEATETLQSFLKGNFENDAALGIAATETTRNAKANEKYAKSFKDLSEAQKVDVLLSMVEAGNEASGAMGQAAREADSWTNVTGELNEAWRLFLGVIGDPLLEGLIPIIQGITSGLKEMVSTTASAELADGMDGFRKSIDDINKEFDRQSQTIEKNAIMADYYRQRMEELESQGLSTAGAQSEYAHAVEALNGIYPELNLQIDAQTGLLDENSRAQLENIEAMKQKALFAAMEQQYTDALSAQADAILEVQEAEKALFDVKAERHAVQEQLTAQTGLESAALYDLYSNQLNAASGLIALSEGTVTLTDEQMKLVQQMIALDAETRNLQQGIDASNETITEYDAKIKEMSETMQSWADKQSDALEQTTEATQTALQEASSAAEDAASAFDDSFSKPTQESAKATGAAVEEAISNPAETMQESWGDKAQWFEANVESPITASTEKMGNAMLTTLADMESQNSASWSRMVSEVEKAITKMQQKIDSLTGKTVNITTSGGGASSASAAAYTPSAAYAAPVGIPYLATGAVIPPNAPFMAVLGDQKNGTNIEAPLETIKQAVAEVVSNMRGNTVIRFEGDLAQLGRILQPVIEEENNRIGRSLSEEVHIW